jgi:hypothetical protein
VLSSFIAKADSDSSFVGSFTIAALTISDVSVSDITTYRATISWKTDGDATSQVFYDTVSHGSVTGYTYHTNENLSPVSVHSVSLTGLSSSTTYYYRAKSVAIVDSIEYIDISPEYTFSTTIGGGGGYGYVGYTVSLIGLTSPITLRLNNAGILQTGAQLTALDGQVSLNIPAGAQLLNAQGQPLSLLSISVLTSVPPSSQDAIVLVYDFGLAGATFTPPITLTFKYDLATLPPGVLEDKLYIAYWDGSQWQKLTSIVDTEDKTVTALVSHFTQFSVMGQLSVPTSAPTPTPKLVLEPTPTPMPVSTHTPAPASQPLNRWLIVGIIGGVGVIVIALIAVLTRRRIR